MYQSCATAWWGDVIRRTAVGADADARRVEDCMERIVPALLHRFSSLAGYRLFDDTLSARAVRSRLG